jgi:hypothetical protein
MLKMNTNTVDRLFKQNHGKAKNFGQVAGYLVANYTEGLDEEYKLKLTANTAVGMAMGAALVKNKYLLIGTAIGAAATGLTVKLYNDFKNRENTEKKEV